MAEERRELQQETYIAGSKPTKRYVFIGPPFNIGKLVDIGVDVPVAFCEHPAAAPMKRYKIVPTERGMNLEGIQKHSQIR